MPCPILIPPAILRLAMPPFPRGCSSSPRFKFLLGKVTICQIVYLAMIYHLSHLSATCYVGGKNEKITTASIWKRLSNGVLSPLVAFMMKNSNTGPGAAATVWNQLYRAMNIVWCDVSTSYPCELDLWTDLARKFTALSWCLACNQRPATQNRLFIAQSQP